MTIVQTSSSPTSPWTLTNDATNARSLPPPQGTLKGFDQSINLILDDSYERVYHPDKGVEQAVLGLYIIRGDNMWVI